MPCSFAFTEFVPHECRNSCISSSTEAGTLLIFMPGEPSTQESKCLPDTGSGTPASIQHLVMFRGQASRFIREQLSFSSALSPDCRKTSLHLLPALCSSSFNNFSIKETIFHLYFALLWFTFSYIKCSLRHY